jgi:hypothetical protein
MLLNDDGQLRVEPSKTLFCVLPFMQSKKVHLFQICHFSNQRQAKPNLLRSYCAAQAWNELSKKKKTDWKPKDHEHFGKLSLWVSPPEIIKQRKIQ